MRLLLPFSILLLSVACAGSRSQVDTLQTSVLVIGGGASGAPAAIQAARLGVDVIVVEQTPWLGGMLTAAAVSATDGNHLLPSGLWGEFRDSLYARYGGPGPLATGWVSNTHFEPWVGAEILANIVAAEPRIQVKHGFRVTAVHSAEGRVTGATFINDQGRVLRISADLTIAADEYGDAVRLSGARNRYGFESRAEFGDSMAPETAFPHVQDLTYVAILKDYGPGIDRTLPAPPGYDPALFNHTCKELSSDPNRNVVHGNDMYVNFVEMTHEQRQVAFEQAKNFTRAWIHHIQKERGYTNLGLAEGRFPTTDNFPPMPYIRESRRIYGVQTVTVRDLKDPYADPSRPLYKQGIAVGDYPLDLHHERKPDSLHVSVTTADLPKIPSYSVPYGALIPETLDGFIAADKHISTTHVVNGSTRLQPVVMGIGQAAGAAAALSVLENTQPRDLNVRQLQQTLLDHKAWLLPFADITPNDAEFQAIQRVAVAGWMRGTGEPSAWANRTWFHPDRAVTEEEIELAVAELRKAGRTVSAQDLRDEMPMSRRLFALMLDSLYDPFQ
ncbi:MAG: hypothetical protein RL177_468 [Bacteroidota bacterium]